MIALNCHQFPSRVNNSFFIIFIIGIFVFDSRSNFGAEMDLTAQIEATIDQGQEYVWSLYSYRSVSKAIPEVV